MYLGLVETTGRWICAGKGRIYGCVCIYKCIRTHMYMYAYMFMYEYMHEYMHMFM